MATKTSSKPAGRAVKDKEVQSTKHDALLAWLFDNASKVVSRCYGMEPDAAQARFSEAKDAAAVWLNEIFDELGDMVSGKMNLPPQGLAISSRGVTTEPPEPPLSDAAKAVVAPILRTRAALLARVQAMAAADSIGDASLRSIEVMKPVNLREAKARGEVRVVPAGFVDAAFEMFVPSGFELRIQDVPRDERWRSDRHFGVSADDDDVIKAARSLAAGSIDVSILGDQRDLWLSVRTDAFTLGEVLQELRTLSQLEDGQHLVALVVDGLDEDMRQRLELQGVMVIDRLDYKT